MAVQIRVLTVLVLGEVRQTQGITGEPIIQRIVMHTVMQAYSMMKEITDHSFEGFKKGQPTMAYFLSQNVDFCRQHVAQMQVQGQDFSTMYNFVPLGLKGFTPNQYQVAMGSLPRVDCALHSDDEAKGFVPAVKTNTYQAVIDALGLQRGDQLTFLMIDGNNSRSFGQCNFHFCRVILDPTNSDHSQAALSSAFLDGEGKVNLPSVRNEGDFTFAIDSTKGLSFVYNGSLTCVACAVIVSRQVNDKWLRSTTYLTCAAAEEYSLGECISNAQAGSNSQIYAANDAYLNNAGQSGGAGHTDLTDPTDSNSGNGSGSLTPDPSPTGEGSENSCVAAPSIGGEGAFTTSTQVTMSGPDGAEIRYTTDGSTPTASSTLYTEPLTVSSSVTLKAIAIKDGQSSEVTTKQFVKSDGGADDPSGFEGA